MANFSFKHDGKTHTFERDLAKVKTFGWQRKHRHLSEEDTVLAIFEEFAGDDALEVLDEMALDSDEFKAIIEDLGEYLAGEAKAR